MAAVAGAVAEIVGRGLLTCSANIVVENGGDIFYRLTGRVIAGIFAGSSPLSMKVGIAIDGCEGPVSLCTSSGTVGHSKSFGKADAVTVFSDSAALADAAATSLGNQVKHPDDIEKMKEIAKQFLSKEIPSVETDFRFFISGVVQYFDGRKIRRHPFKAGS